VPGGANAGGTGKKRNVETGVTDEKAESREYTRLGEKGSDPRLDRGKTMTEEKNPGRRSKRGELPPRGEKKEEE